MNPNQLAMFLAEKGFSVKQVPLGNTISKLGRDGVNTFDLTENFCDKFIGSKFWTCVRCSKMFESQSSLVSHVAKEHRTEDTASAVQQQRRDDETSYIIIRTDPSAERLEARRKPRRQETKPRKRYETRADSFRVQIHGPFTCNVCQQRFEECCGYSMHMNAVHFKRRRLILRCTICEKRFGGQGYGDEAATAGIDGRSEASPFACDLCGETFSLQAHLDFHRRKRHVRIKPYECSLCAKSFSQIVGLSQHMKTHSGLKPFACQVCSKTFRQKAGLDQHARIHTKTKPFSCLLCDRAFTQSAHLRQHMRIHTKIEPFECGICDKRFKQSSHLNFHLRSHAAARNDTNHMPADIKEESIEQSAIVQGGSP